MRRRLPLAALCLLCCLAIPVRAASLLDDPWPEPAIDEASGVEVTLASRSPFVLEDVGSKSASFNPPRQVAARLYVPEGASAARKVPAIVMLHGAAGVQQSRERIYGPQYAAMGVAALVVDTFGSRRDMATDYVDRMLRITETTMVADAYTALAFLAARGEIDARRVALVGFSYGGMAAVLAAYDQVANRFAPGGGRFAAHVGYYSPCLASFENNRATGAPILMLMGEKDVVVDRKRCGEIAAELRRGGAQVEEIVYSGAYSAWDGELGAPGNPLRRAHNIAPCRFNVERNNTVRDARSGIEMSNPFFRKVILGVCSDRDGYLVARDPAVRVRSNRDVGKFLSKVFEVR
jgi:dienelactone hydrolase